MRKIIQVVHTSIDGYVAGPNGELDWFENAEEHLEFVNELIKGSDSALFGRNTYEQFNEYWPLKIDDVNSSKTETEFAKWYRRSTKIVFSKSKTHLNTENTLLIGNDIATAISELKNNYGQNIIIFGSPTIGQLLTDLNLVDEYWIFINPVFFRSGVPLFSKTGNRTRLKLLETKTIPNGEVALHYSSH